METVILSIRTDKATKQEAEKSSSMSLAST